MSLTLLYRGKKVKFAYSVSKRRMMAGLALAFGVVMISGRSTQTPEETYARLNFAQTGLSEQRQELESVKAATEQQLAGMVLKLGEVQSQLQRVNALGARLVEQADLNPQEFSFDDLPAAGGPLSGDTIQIAGNNEMLAQIDQVMSELDNKSQQLLALESILMNHHINEERYLEGRPIRKGWLSSYYGIRKDPFTGQPAMHEGLDFAGKDGADVISTGAGIVTWSGERYGYGNLIEIDHGDGLVTRYGHNKSLNVKIGDIVTKGQVIAKMGSTGRSTGAHVHYEVLKHGRHQDPLPYVVRR